MLNIIRSDTRHFGTRFAVILTAFMVLFLLSRPVVLSFDLWVFKDRSSFLNLDYLLEKHLVLGVDTFYSYGLLPVLIQHYLFEIFGRGTLPIVGFSVFSIVLMAAFWALLLDHMPKERIWLLLIAAMSSVLFLITPNLPYWMVILSLLFSLLFLLRERLDLALAVAAFGCVSVPSLPLVLTALLVFLIVVKWWMSPGRPLSHLIRQLAPGALTYGVLAGIIIMRFGIASFLATALPVLGMSFYKTAGFGLRGMLAFTRPDVHDLRYNLIYYSATMATWWIFSSIVLFAFGGMAAFRMIRKRQLPGVDMFLFVSAALHGVFVFLAYGAPEQHTLYDPLLAAAMLIGISTSPNGKVRTALLVLFGTFGILGQALKVRNTQDAWVSTKPYSVSGSTFYAAPAWMADWSRIVDLSKTSKTLLMSYGTGVHHYYPTLESCQCWFLGEGLLFPMDIARVAEQMRRADVVVESLDLPFNKDPILQHQFSTMCLSEATPNFKIWRKTGACGQVKDTKTPAAVLPSE